MSEKVERGKMKEKNKIKLVPRRDELSHSLSNGATNNRPHAPPTTIENVQPQRQQNVYSKMIGNG